MTATFDDEQLRSVLRQHFGFADFRPGQLDVVRRVVRGESTLAVLPTGLGKSLCYQLPAFIAAKQKKFAVVVSPLISLMADQMRALPKCITGCALKCGEAQEAVQAIEKGRLQVVFVSPERVAQNAAFVSAFRRVAHLLAFVCIDEVHCLSEWGANYRTSYLHLARILRDELGAKCFLGLTATCLADTMRGVCSNLDIQFDDCPATHTQLSESAELVTQGGVVRVWQQRHNLRLSASRVAIDDAVMDQTARKTARLRDLARLLTTPPFCDLASVIVYTTMRFEADEVADFLRGHVTEACASYHGQKPAEIRRQVQKDFFSGKVRIIVATIAFGMGIDKADVRGIIHLNVPKSLEEYTQEVGRAGRDGKPAYCHVFVDKYDFWALHSRCHCDLVSEKVVAGLCHRVFDVANLERNRKIEKAGLPVVSFLRKDRTQCEFDTKEEILDTLIGMLAIHWPELVSPPVEMHQLYLFRMLDADASEGNPVALAKGQRKRQPAGLQISAIIAQLKEEDHCLNYLTNICASTRQVKKDWYKVDVQHMAHQLRLSVEEAAQRLKELRDRRVLRLSPTAPSYVFTLRAPLPDQGEVAAIASELAQRHTALCTALRDKLKICYSLLEEHANRHSEHQTEPEPQDGEPKPKRRRTSSSFSTEQLSSSLHRELETYFRVVDASGCGALAAAELSEEDRKWQRRYLREIPAPQPVTKGETLLADLRMFLETQGAQFDDEYQLARVLHAMPSPLFPHGDKCRVWGKYTDRDFSQLLKVCRNELQNWRRCFADPVSDP